MDRGLDHCGCFGEGALGLGRFNALLTPLFRITILALTVRLFAASLGFASNLAFPLAHPQQFTVLARSDPFWDSFARYDSGWYFTIAHDGYRYIPDERNNLAFFPVYPLLMRYLGALLGGAQQHYYQAGIAISWAAFFLAMILLHRLARLDVDAESADRATLYAAVFPFAFFYGCVYLESLFLLLTLASFYGFRTGHWTLGSISGALAAATRPNGILIVPALAYIAWRQADADRSRQAAALAALAGICAGLGAYCAYVYSLSGSPLEWMHSIQRWNYHPGGTPWSPLVALARQLVRRPHDFLMEPNGLYDTLNGVTALIVLLSVPFVWTRLGTAYGLFMALNLALPLSSGEFEGLGRYCAVLFPFFIWLATCRVVMLQQIILIVSVSVYVLCLMLFVTLHPIF
jgi:hypothetical protein